jgi:hypothetical protein
MCRQFGHLTISASAFSLGLGFSLLLAVVQLGDAELEEVVPLVPEAGAVAGVVEDDAVRLAVGDAQPAAEELDVLGERLAQGPGHDDAADVGTSKPFDAAVTVMRPRIVESACGTR